MMSSAISFTLYDSRRFVIQSGAAMTQDTGRPPVLSHQDFVSEVQRTGLTPVTVETFVAYQFAASYSNKLVWLITGWMQMLFTSPAVSVAIVILAFVLRDWRILLAIPAAIYGPPGIYGLRSYRLPDYQKRWRRDDASPEERYMWRRKRGDRIANRLHQLLDFVALAGLCYTWFTFGWRSPWFLICAAYLVTFFECVIYHALVWRAFTRMLINDPDFYNAALATGAIRY